MPLFAGMSEAGLALVAAGAAELDVEAVLALPGPGSGMFVIRDGEVTVESRAGPITLGRGTSSASSHSSSRTRAASRVCGRRRRFALSISRDDFLALAETEPTFTLELCASWRGVSTCTRAERPQPRCASPLHCRGCLASRDRS